MNEKIKNRLVEAAIVVMIFATVGIIRHDGAVSIGPDITAPNNPFQDADHPDARAFKGEVERLGWQVGLIHGFVSRCLPRWENELAGHAELTVFLDGMNTPKTITAVAIAEFDKGADSAADMTCGDDESSQVGAMVMSEMAKETIYRLKALSFVPTVFYKQGNPL